MCLAVPGKVERITGMKAIVAYGSHKRAAILTGELPVKVGDYVLVQVGCVVQKLGRDEAEESINAWNSMNDS